ncbi:MAG: LPXTG cell wall anchor domain-containing protein, partial [Erysipelotrichia bacterium]|nr:LPXTG cell wall anchor domain-containing protein [Erysipelotrichia bacterium]
MMKKIKQLFLLCTLVFMLSGCFKVNMNIDVKSDGSADMSVEMLVSKATLEYAETSVDDLKQSMLEGMDQEELKYITFKDVNKTIDEEAYVGFQMDYDTKHVTPEGFKDVITIKDDRITFLMGQEDIGSFANDELASVNDSMEGVEFNFNITMPGKILEHNVGEVNNQTVTIDLLKLKDTKIEITSELSSDHTITIVIIVIAILIIAGGIFFIFKKKKNHSDIDHLQKENITNNTLSSNDAVEK